MIRLSIVLISKNQAWNMPRLIESVLRGTASIPSREIILVDSASTDQTVELAGRYPINIVRLRASQPLCPAAGRYIGYQSTRGEFVLFLDGDTELIEGWLPHAMRVMREQPDAGAVTGSVVNLPTSATSKGPWTTIPKRQMAPPSEVLWCNYGGGGVALYRRGVLEKVGTFNPYLHSEEEPELGLRIRHAGFRILAIDYPVAHHYNDAPVALSTPLSRRKRNFHLGIGQAARSYLGSELFWRWIKERWWDPAATLLMAAGLGSVFLSLVTGSFLWFALWALGICLLIALLAFRKRSLRSALVAAFAWLVMAEGFLKGFLISPRQPASFQPDVEAIKASGRRDSVPPTLTGEPPDCRTLGLARLNPN